MPVSRMRMRPWLEQMIESRNVPGLQWVDKNKTMFSIPWKHAARHGWELHKDASLFKMWAIHTGKYVEGQTCDPKTWKANFRCAMNSLPDIEEVKDKSVNKGHQAMRVFRMLPAAPKCRDKRKRATKQRRRPQVKYEEDSSDSECVPSPTETPNFSSTQDSRVDSTFPAESQESLFSREVPEWSSLVEVGFSEFTRQLQVSPSHSSSPPDDNEIVEICAEWERERLWTSGSDNRTSFCLSSNRILSNEVHCTSPGSQYSEQWSADELDEPAQYTNLDAMFPMTFPPADDTPVSLNPFHESTYQTGLSGHYRTI